MHRVARSDRRVPRAAERDEAVEEVGARRSRRDGHRKPPRPVRVHPLERGGEARRRQRHVRGVREGGADPGESRLSFDLRAVEGGTELTLTHARLHDEESRASHEGGWSGALDKLEKMFG